MEAVSLVKGQTVDLKKADGTLISKIRVGAGWDVGDTGADVDLFVVQKNPKTIAFFNAKTAIAGIKLGADNLTGEGEGDDETADFDATVSVDGEYFVCLNIYSGAATFGQVKNLSARVYNSETNEILASQNITENGGSNNGIILGVIKDIGNAYTYTAIGDYVNGDINQIAASI